MEDLDNNFQDRLLEIGHMADSELANKIMWLNRNGIKLNTWQLVKFTGFDRGIGKTYVSQLLNIYNKTDDLTIDEDYELYDSRRSMLYAMELKAMRNRYNK